MGVPSNSERNWIERISKEERAKAEFKTKWGWMSKYYEEQEKAIKKLKEIVAESPEACKCRESAKAKKKPSKEAPDIVLPKFPVTTSQEIGWLSADPAYALETVSPYPNTRPAKISVTPPGLFPMRDIQFYINWYQIKRKPAKKTTGPR